MRKDIRACCIIVAVTVILYAGVWLAGVKKNDIDWGISFNHRHAESLGSDWQDVYMAMLYDLKPKHIRIAAMWSDIEAKQGEYWFGDIDWMMYQAKEAGVGILLVVGQKAPRWPECHIPEWVDNYDNAQAQAYLLDYMRKTVNRYKDHEALELWQVENEPYINFKFGDCERYDQSLVEQEINLVQSIDPNHKIVITDSGELSTWRKASKAGDIFGTTLYRIVQMPSGRTFTYDIIPAGFYKLKALLWGRGGEDFFISELQAEPWFTESNPLNTPITVQEETMNPKRLENHITYAQHTGASRAYLWGVEWWYWIMHEHGDSRYWNIVQSLLADTGEE